jgi:GNAT superfamily N-acetyltransferase
VDETYRGRGIGKALLLACLHDMWAQGYGYAIIGWAGPVDFYIRAVGAIVIPDSSPGIYRGMLKG